ncbi:MAG: hypothetical protein ABI863_07450 [Ginsengibacter sp.]
MGLSIHYSGSFNAKASLEAMIEEVKDIVEVYKWPYLVFESKFSAYSFGKAEYAQDIYGICFTPPECETVSLCFLSNGKMSDVLNLRFYGTPESEEDAEYLYMLSVKTQYAGIEIHKLLIRLLRYISSKYLQDFILRDEGEYWETGNEKLLQDAFKRYTVLIEIFASSLENYPKKSGENFEAYFERLVKQIHEKRKE